VPTKLTNSIGESEGCFTRLAINQEWQSSAAPLVVVLELTVVKVVSKLSIKLMSANLIIPFLYETSLPL
jgi:hypothetical protein